MEVVLTMRAIPWRLAFGECRGLVGDWRATAVLSRDRRSVATGVLEIARSGETLLDIDFIGDGPSGTLRATGLTDLESRSLALLGIRGPDDTRVALVGACDAFDQELVCLFDVDDLEWTLRFLRER